MGYLLHHKGLPTGLRSGRKPSQGKAFVLSFPADTLTEGLDDEVAQSLRSGGNPQREPGVRQRERQDWSWWHRGRGRREEGDTRTAGETAVVVQAIQTGKCFDDVTCPALRDRVRTG